MRNFLLVLTFMSTLAAAADWPEMSIYHLEGIWKNQEGTETKLSDLSGKPVVMAMVYTTCQHTCPMITSQIQQIRKSIPEQQQKNVRYALVSFDPKGDTPSVLRAYKKKHKLDEHWILLTGSDLEVRKVAGVLGVNYKKTPDGGFSHSNIIALLDKSGILITKIERLNQDTSMITQKLKQLVH